MLDGRPGIDSRPDRSIRAETPDSRVISVRAGEQRERAVANREGCCSCEPRREGGFAGHGVEHAVVVDPPRDRPAALVGEKVQIAGFAEPTGKRQRQIGGQAAQLDALAEGAVGVDSVRGNIAATGLAAHRADGVADKGRRLVVHEGAARDGVVAEQLGELVLLGGLLDVVTVLPIARCRRADRMRAQSSARRPRWTRLRRGQRRPRRRTGRPTGHCPIASGLSSCRRTWRSHGSGRRG